MAEYSILYMRCVPSSLALTFTCMLLSSMCNPAAHELDAIPNNRLNSRNPSVVPSLARRVGRPATKHVLVADISL